MTTSTLPAFGWTDHSEQIDAAALEARAWKMHTKLMFNGFVLTTLLQTPEHPVIEKLERIAQHARLCKNPLCPYCSARDELAKLCPGGKFDATVTCFYTVAFDSRGQPLEELRAVSTTPEKAHANHMFAVNMIAGALSAWSGFGSTKA